MNFSTDKVARFLWSDSSSSSSSDSSSSDEDEWSDSSSSSDDSEECPILRKLERKLDPLRQMERKFSTKAMFRKMMKKSLRGAGGDDGDDSSDSFDDDFKLSRPPARKRQKKIHGGEGADPSLDKKDKKLLEYKIQKAAFKKKMTESKMLEMQIDSLFEQLKDPRITKTDHAKLKDKLKEATNRFDEFAFGKSISSSKVGGDNSAVPRIINTEDDDMTQISALTQPASTRLVGNDNNTSTSDNNESTK